MRTRTTLLVLALALLPHPAGAQTVTDEALFDRAAIRRALTASPPPASQTGLSDWSRVRRLDPGDEISVSTRTWRSRSVLMLDANDATLTVLDLAALPADLAARYRRRLTSDDARALIAAGGPGVVRLARDDVSEISAWTRRGSKVGAVLGAAGGAFLGFVSALNLAYKDCQGDCTDEKVWMGVTLVGLPVAGGLGGYYLPARRTQTTTYIKPKS